jgi:rubrerythrin
MDKDRLITCIQCGQQEWESDALIMGWLVFEKDNEGTCPYCNKGLPDVLTDEELKGVSQ